MDDIVIRLSDSALAELEDMNVQLNLKSVTQFVQYAVNNQDTEEIDLLNLYHTEQIPKQIQDYKNEIAGLKETIHRLSIVKICPTTNWCLTEEGLVFVYQIFQAEPGVNLLTLEGHLFRHTDELAWDVWINSYKTNEEAIHEGVSNMIRMLTERIVENGVVSKHTLECLKFAYNRLGVY